MQQRRQFILAGLSASALSACQNLSPVATSLGTTMNTMQAFLWGISVSNYNIDMGNVTVETMARDCYLKDAQGNLVGRFYGSKGGWGIGGTPMGGTPEMRPLPASMRLAWYDYQVDLFFEVDIQFPLDRLLQLFSEKEVDIQGTKYGQVIPKYKKLTLGLGPNGFVVVWVSAGDGLNKVELGTYQAHPIQGMTVAKYNQRDKPPFPLDEDRWGVLSDNGTYRTALKKETVEKLKSGWTPSAQTYKDRRIKYPWRYNFVGGGRLVEFRDNRGNEETEYVGPWEMQLYQTQAALRGVPLAITSWFMDKRGQRHRLYMGFFSQYRVAGEPDIRAVWDAFEHVLGKRDLDHNDDWPADDEMATVEVFISDDVKQVAVTLRHGDKSADIPIGRHQHFSIEPYAHAPGQETPTPEEIRLLTQGPNAA